MTKPMPLPQAIEGRPDSRPLHVKEGHADPWEPWFAWYPVWREPNGIWTWLRRVERRRFYAAPWFCIRSWMEYRLPPALPSLDELLNQEEK